MCDRWRKYEELIRTGEEEKLAKLVRRKEDINAESGPLKKTLVHLVAEHGHVELLMQLLAREANLSVVSMIGDTPAHLAARQRTSPGGRPFRLKRYASAQLYP